MLLQHWLPAGHVERRDKRSTVQIRPLLGLPVGGTWGPKHQGLGPWERQEEEAPKRGRGPSGHSHGERTRKKIRGSDLCAQKES